MYRVQIMNNLFVIILMLQKVILSSAQIKHLGKILAVTYYQNISLVYKGKRCSGTKQHCYYPFSKLLEAHPWYPPLDARALCNVPGNGEYVGGAPDHPVRPVKKRVLVIKLDF